MIKLLTKMTLIGICSLSGMHNVLAVNYPLIPDKSLALEIARSGYTRFAMEDERISDVFVFPQEQIDVHIHNQGYLIIVPSEENREGNNSSRKIHLTITGEKGTTQDLSLRFTGGDPEPVKFVKLEWDNTLTKKEFDND